MRPRKPYRLTFNKQTGKYYCRLPGQNWRTTGTSKEHEAHAFALNLLIQAKNDPAGKKGPSPAAQLLKDYAGPAFDAYVKAKAAAAGKKGGLSEGYIIGTRNYLKRFLSNDPLGELPLGRITPDDYQAFQNRLLLEKLAKRRTTAIKVLEAVRLVLRRAEKLGHIPRSPDRATEVPQANPRSRDTYTDTELETLFPADVWEKDDFTPWADAYSYTAGILAASTGMRRNEVIGIPGWDAVHLEAGREYMEIRGSAQRHGQLGPTKGKRPRATPIFDFILWPDRRAVKALKELRRLAVANARIIGIDGEPQGPVFSLEPGHRFGPTWWDARFRAALKEAKINRDRGEGMLPLDAHSLRHTLASHLKAAGMPDDLIRRFCGWSSVNVQERYTHIGPEVFTRIMELVRATERG